ncbi:MAG: heterodisulfide reductase-related iron-sulfur binding cluster [Pseudomonadota bacterium]|nr:heterodisulfide reductase-related iron-sulfur binding cluster [Pseudomonadota bacterium]
MSYKSLKEGSLDAPTRLPIEWESEDFYNEEKINSELERVFDICHTCRRCVSLCNSFPSLFDLIDDSETMEVDGVSKNDYKKVVDECYLCDICYLTKCPYVPPHEWNVDFPHLMLRAKAANFKKGQSNVRDKIITSTKVVGNLAGLPVVAPVVNALNKNSAARTVLEKTLGIHKEAPLPRYHSNKFLKRKDLVTNPILETSPTEEKIAIFVTCYGNVNSPQLVEDMISVFEHNGIRVSIINSDECCGMPKYELGDLASVAEFAKRNLEKMKPFINAGYKITAPIPSCVLMYRKELPLMFPEDENIETLSNAMIDPFELLMNLHKQGKLNTNFTNQLGNVAYHAPCHQRVQNIGPKTKEVLELIPGTKVSLIERCSGHDGTYAVKKESYPRAKKICRPVVSAIEKSDTDHFVSDCPMAFDLIEQEARKTTEFASAFGVLKHAYGVQNEKQ